MTNIWLDSVLRLVRPVIIAIRKRITLPDYVSALEEIIRVANSLGVEEEIFIGTVKMSVKQSNGTVEDKVCDSPEINNSSKVEVQAVESDNDEWYSMLKFGEESVKLKIDTGAKCNVFPQRTFNKINQGRGEVTQPKVKLISYSCDSIQTVG